MKQRRRNRRKQKQQNQNKIKAVLFFFIICCFISGCAHGQNEGVKTTVTDSHSTEASDEKTAEVSADDEDDDFFDDEDEDLDVADLKKEKKLVADPLYYFNKSMYHFNDKLYFWALKPTAKAYKKVTPGFFRTGVKNFFNNLKMPVRFTSCLLQGKVKGAGTEVGRFLVNTTLGFGGVIDTATHSFKMKERDEDLGQVLGKYGIGNGFYLYLPLLGPSTLRDSIGTAGATFLSPTSYMENREAALGLYGFSSLNSVSFMIGNYEAVKSASLDPYSMIRDFYIEQRKKKIKE